MAGMLEAVIPETSRGARLDQALATLFPDYSRTRLKSWIEEGRVALAGRRPRPRDRVEGGERVAVALPVASSLATPAQPLPLDIVHEDAAGVGSAAPARPGRRRRARPGRAAGRLLARHARPAAAARHRA